MGEKPKKDITHQHSPVLSSTAVMTLIPKDSIWVILLFDCLYKQGFLGYRRCLFSSILKGRPRIIHTPSLLDTRVRFFTSSFLCLAATNTHRACWENLRKTCAQLAVESDFFLETCTESSLQRESTIWITGNNSVQQFEDPSSISRQWFTLCPVYHANHKRMRTWDWHENKASGTCFVHLQHLVLLLSFFFLATVMATLWVE